MSKIHFPYCIFFDPRKDVAGMMWVCGRNWLLLDGGQAVWQRKRRKASDDVGVDGFVGDVVASDDEVGENVRSSVHEGNIFSWTTTKGASEALMARNYNQMVD